MQAWKVEAKRQTLFNKWIAEDGPPILTGLESFCAANVRLRTDVVAYLAAARQHERNHTTRMEKAIRADDPGKFAEKAAAQASRDPLPRIWSGKVAVPAPDTGMWTVITTDI